MTTTYGMVKLRDGRTLAVNAGQMAGRVMLCVGGDERADQPAISDETELRALIGLLTIAGQHVWEDFEP